MARKMKTVDQRNIKKAVKEKYAAIASGDMQCSSSPSECRGEGLWTIDALAPEYDPAELAGIPEGADLGLGCGIPTAGADLKRGQTVLDLGSGAGVDAFLAAKKVGPSGRVIGVDMTDEMIEKARANARRGGFKNVRFRKGEIERLPVASGTVDRIISNCVINLAPDKEKVFAEAYRVLKPGGAIAVSDIVSIGEIPASVRSDMERWAGCTAGALDRDEYLQAIRAAGFRRIRILKESPYDFLRGPGYSLESLTVRAMKQGR